jgi:hypothetical protein
MMKILRKGAVALMIIALLAGLSAAALAVSPAELDSMVTDTGAYIYQTVKDPQVGSIGGEWAIVGLARSGCKVPDTYYQDYYATVEKYVEACKGVLHNKKYTEYSRVTLALTAIGKDPRNVAGYNLLTPLGDYDKTIWQGLNGPIWALIALDAGNYPIPQNPAAKTQATRDMYVDRILACQLPDGGFSLFGGTSAATSGDQTADPDITGMALQALAKYQDRADVKKVIGEALGCMSKKQDKMGGFSSWGTSNSESVVQMLVTLTELGVPLDDPRFVKNGYTLLDSLMTFYLPGKGFQHTADGSGSNQMATEQGFYGLVAAQRARDGKPSLYRMSDALHIGTGTGTNTVKGAGLEGKNADVKAVPITKPGTTFDDIVYSDEITAIETLASREIITGMGDGTFSPDATMTRAQFAAVIVRALGLTPKTSDVFSDVLTIEWYAPYVGTANTYGIVSGITGSSFDPLGTITRQEAAVMVARASKLCGIKTDMDSGAVRDVLAQFGDYVESSDWARPSLAFCYSNDILSQKDLDIRPKDPAKRGEIAQMVFNMLGAANLL